MEELHSQTDSEAGVTREAEPMQAPASESLQTEATVSETLSQSEAPNTAAEPSAQTEGAESGESGGYVYDVNPSPQDTVFECRNLSKLYGSFTALHGVNLAIPAGGIVGLLGPNGSGKTTLIKLAMGMLQPSEGEIRIDGKKPSAETKAVTAYLPDANYLFKWMRVEQMLNYYSDFFVDFNRQKAEAMLQRLGIGLKQKIKTLSKGNQEKLGLLLTMARDAKLYILDEPIAGVDPAAREFILDTIMKNKPENATIFLCTHLIADIEPILTHAIFLRSGQVALNAPVAEIKAREGKTLDELFREVFRW